MYILILFVILASDCINYVDGNRMLRKLNAKIKIFQRDMDDLKVQLEIERDRTNELEKRLNETTQDFSTFIGNGDYQDSSNTPLVVEALKKRLDKQEETTQLIENELENEKDKRINLETIVESLKEKSKVVEEEAMTTKDAMERFTFIMKSAFKAEKSLLRNLAKTVNIDILKDIFEKEINAVMVTTNKSIQSVRKDITILKDEIIKVDEMVDKNGEDIDQLNFTLADTDGRVDANEQQLESMSGCCSASTRVETTTRVTRVTPKPTTGGDLVPVTLVPGGPLILPLYEEELANAIKIGSRVVRGRDWVWRDQMLPGDRKRATSTNWFLCCDEDEESVQSNHKRTQSQTDSSDAPRILISLGEHDATGDIAQGNHDQMFDNLPVNNITAQTSVNSDSVTDIGSKSTGINASFQSCQVDNDTTVKVKKAKNAAGSKRQSSRKGKSATIQQDIRTDIHED